MFEGARYDKYIEKWKLHEVINEAVSDVLTRLPENPYEHLRDMFSALCETSPSPDPFLKKAPANELCGKSLTPHPPPPAVAPPPKEDLDLDRSGSLRGGELPTSNLHTLKTTRSFFKQTGTYDGAAHKSSISFGRQSSYVARKKTSLSAAERLGPEFLEKLLHISLDLCSNVTHSEVLLPCIIESCQELLNADRCSLFLLEDDFLVTQIKSEEVIRVHKSTGLAGHCATTGVHINLADAYEDTRFNRTVDDMTGYRTKSLLCAPITCDGDIVAVAQLLNKTENGVISTFTSEDLNLFKTYAAFAGLAIHNAELYNEQESLMQKNKFFISVLETLSQADMRKWGTVVEDVSRGAAAVLNAERCTLFMVDKEKNELYAPSEHGEIRFASFKGIAGTVFTSGEILNLKDPYSDSRFNPEIDRQTGLTTRSLLTMPVHYMGQVIAVAQVVNKHDKGGFTTEDEETLRYFAHFAGVTLSNSKLYDFVLESRNKTMALFEKQLEVLSEGSSPRSVKTRKRNNTQLRRSFKVHSSEVSLCMECSLTQEEIELACSCEFNIDAFRSPEQANKLLQVIVSLFQRLDLFNLFSLPVVKFVTFLCAVRAKYRNLPYHNFLHAADVTQTLFTYLHKGDLRTSISDLEVFALMVSGLLHDIDHMGLNNSFHFTTESPLGILSSASGATSVLEVHHCHVGLQLLEEEELDIFSGVDKDLIAELNHMIVSNILSTDMAKHSQLLQRARCIFFAGYIRDNREHTKLLCQFLLKSADISNVTKPFNLSKNWGVLVTEEFHWKGEGAESSAESTKSSKKGVTDLVYLARGQLDFIEDAAMPTYETLAKAFPGVSWPLEQLKSNVARWKELLQADTVMSSPTETI